MLFFFQGVGGERETGGLRDLEKDPGTKARTNNKLYPHVGPKSHFEIKVSTIIENVLSSNAVHFVSLLDNFTAPFSKLLKLPSLMENKTA